MEYLVTQAEMKQYDCNTIERLKMPSIVLMERAALVTAWQIRKVKGNLPYKVLVVSGTGNNGGDGLAIGRLLMLQGCTVDFVLIGDSKKCSAETTLQLTILAQYGYKPYDTIPEGEYDIVIDALFGIGLSREIEGKYKDAITLINQLNSYICSVDIPSGICADTGKILGCAVQADLTVSYGFYKLGLFLYPGAGYCGKIICGRMGIDECGFFGNEPHWYTYKSLADAALPRRRANGNKGTFGKALVIAGSDTICGAALLACRSAFKMGAGMVKLITSKMNREVIQNAVPEVMVSVYDMEPWQEEPDDTFLTEFREALAWADCILIGPGIGTGKEAAWLLKACLFQTGLPIVIDADGLNLLAEEKLLPHKEAEKKHRKIILTPHLGEFSRLYGCTVSEVAKNLTIYPQNLADRMQCIVVCKDARTIIAKPDGAKRYLNTSGNAGMATAGSGDVLAGMITGLLAQGMDAMEAAVTGTYLHGVAGDMAAGIHGEYSMMASDIIDQIPELLKQKEIRKV